MSRLVGVAARAHPGLTTWYDMTDIVVPQKPCRLPQKNSEIVLYELNKMSIYITTEPSATAASAAGPIRARKFERRGA